MEATIYSHQYSPKIRSTNDKIKGAYSKWLTRLLLFSCLFSCRCSCFDHH